MKRKTKAAIALYLKRYQPRKYSSLQAIEEIIYLNAARIAHKKKKLPIAGSFKRIFT